MRAVPERPDCVLLVVQSAEVLLNFRAGLIRTLVRSGVRVVTAAPPALDEPRLKRGLRELGVSEHHHLPIKRAGLNPFDELQSFAASWSLVRRVRPTCVLACMAKAIAAIIAPAWLCRVPKRIALIEGLGYAFTDGREAKRAIARLLLSAVYRLSLPLATEIVVLNPDDASEVVDRGWSRPEKVRCVEGIGLPLGSFKPAPLPPGELTFIYVGRLLIDKGVRELLEAASLLRTRNRSFKLRLVGGYDENPASLARPELDIALDRAGAEWTGYSRDVAEDLRRSHVLLLPSYREGFPRSVMEAAAVGRSAIVSDVPGCRSAVVEEKTGLLVRPRDATALAAAMERYLDEPDLAVSMGSNASRHASAFFDEDELAERLLRAVQLGR